MILSVFPLADNSRSSSCSRTRVRRIVCRRWMSNLESVSIQITAPASGLGVLPSGAGAYREVATKW